MSNGDPGLRAFLYRTAARAITEADVPHLRHEITCLPEGEAAGFICVQQNGESPRYFRVRISEVLEPRLKVWRKS